MLQIYVFSNECSYKENKPCFEQLCVVNKDIQIPYDSLISSLRFMFGVKSVVTFNFL